ncbi:MAG: OmpA family protein [Magnetococcales bacterium]|nr:OmpA family protein [Magnetococcales bacterium]MBF0148470.1 OmpA family protein [Magnetococcales bacterium]MBF0172618.1 OmpA family protein [Magnetococcales bacterium]MBF0629933.1 OmpA family protein [Magnetococcales bacterium]
MLGLKTAPRKSTRTEAEKPFWISFSDLMTALMVLFLVAMTVALMSVTQKVISGPEAHRKKVDACMAEVAAMTLSQFPGVEVMGHTIGFGTLALFATNKHRLDTRAETTLRAYVPKVLALTRSPGCESVFKRVIVEGFASQRGTYIHNLDLSLKRAERVLCILLDPSAPDALDERDRRDVRNLFLVGGSSFNALKSSDAESQRIEMKLEFLGYEEDRERIRDAPLDQELICPLD